MLAESGKGATLGQNKHRVQSGALGHILLVEGREKLLPGRRTRMKREEAISQVPLLGGAPLVSGKRGISISPPKHGSAQSAFAKLGVHFFQEMYPLSGSLSMIWNTSEGWMPFSQPLPPGKKTKKKQKTKGGCPRYEKGCLEIQQYVIPVGFDFFSTPIHKQFGRLNGDGRNSTPGEGKPPGY